MMMAIMATPSPRCLLLFLLAFLVAGDPASSFSFRWWKTATAPTRQRRRQPSFLLRAGSSSQSVEDDSAPQPRRRQRAVILMDCFCSYLGLYLASHIKATYPDVVLVFAVSEYLHGYLTVTDPDARDERWNDAKVPTSTTAEETIAWKAKRGLDDNVEEIVGVYCESDSGLEDAERLRQQLNVTCQDDPCVLEARRNKYEMNKLLRETTTNLEVVQQQLCHSIDEAQQFAATTLLINDNCVIVKPIRGCGTESVYLCKTLDDVKRAFQAITSTKIFGTQIQHSSVLVQEFLQGTEYALDVVSRGSNGQQHHKVAAIWRYDKRPANGAAFCYFQTKLVDATTDANVEAIAEYVKTTLTALGIKFGLSHNEVIVVEGGRGPVLVEVNCRQHNMDFAPLTMACIGYNALDMTAAALLLDDDEEWNNAYSDMPTLRAAGCMVHLVNYQTGKVLGVHHLDEINDLPSVFNWEIYESFGIPGSEITPTIDIKTDAGWIQLIDEDDEQLQQDYEKIVSLMPTLFQLQEEEG